ncbi:type II toxin-antitoxin system antitoxin SocA domain-containing protein [Bacillus toyonensis]|uniref:Panacea domain-containing protein n=1 Tax=Bacillus toyonensis TaxID=155322 RepID=UPI000CD91C50|nr:type II toxin-antitoxin system antitoxin SocA domain-containing protein [Bacillus toyonensis]MED3536220.1 DUF4065 domain-containing protein [Bacillus toyonensis]MEE2018263.1 DUF4065 domain-containing protein [Bacillus toyonensis]
MAEVRNVAKYFIHLSEESTPYAITPLKLQKLLYYAQGFHLRDTGYPLFNDNLLAWAHGPVVRDIYDDYRHLGYFTIKSEPFYITNHELTNEEIETIENVWEEYGHLDGKLLEELTHQEDPWLFTHRNEVIDIDLIREYFANQLILNN